MGFLDNFFTGSTGNDGGGGFEATPRRAQIKVELMENLKKRGFTQMEINEIMDVITLAEADMKIAEDSLLHVNVNNDDPTRAMHAAIQDMRKYQKELAYNVRKKIMDIMIRKQSMRRR
ncbi:hypothetical protein IJG14_05945 [bacterium]|nr:hypothetical protein [bacterium]